MFGRSFGQPCKIRLLVEVRAYTTRNQHMYQEIGEYTHIRWVTLCLRILSRNASKLNFGITTTDSWFSVRLVKSRNSEVQMELTPENKSQCNLRTQVRISE